MVAGPFCSTTEPFLGITLRLSTSVKRSVAPFLHKIAPVFHLVRFQNEIGPGIFSPKPVSRQIESPYTGTCPRHRLLANVAPGLNLLETRRGTTGTNRHPSPKTDHKPDIAQYAKASQLLPRSGTLVHTKLTKI